MNAAITPDAGSKGLIAAWCPVFLLFARTSPLEPCEALEVIGQVRRTDLDPDSGDADGADKQSHAVLLAC